MTKLFITFLTVITTSPVFAETIILKNDNIIEGKIIERTSEQIKVDLGIGIPISYYMDDSDSVDGIKIPETLKTTDDTLSDANVEREPLRAETLKKQTRAKESHLSKHPTFGKLFTWGMSKEQIEEAIGIILP